MTAALSTIWWSLFEQKKPPRQWATGGGAVMSAAPVAAQTKSGAPAATVRSRTVGCDCGPRSPSRPSIHCTAWNCAQREPFGPGSVSSQLNVVIISVDKCITAARDWLTNQATAAEHAGARTGSLKRWLKVAVLHLTMPLWRQVMGLRYPRGVGAEAMAHLVREEVQQ